MMLRVLYLWILGALAPASVFATALPIPEHGPALRIQGSNTIGAALGPALVEGLLREQGLIKVHREMPATTNSASIFFMCVLLRDDFVQQLYQEKKVAVAPPGGSICS